MWRGNKADLGGDVRGLGLILSDERYSAGTFPAEKRGNIGDEEHPRAPKAPKAPRPLEVLARINSATPQSWGAKF